MIKIEKTIDELIKTDESPLCIDVIPNYMGINLCAVKSIGWTRQVDEQLIDLTINFIPNNEIKTYLGGKMVKVKVERVKKSVDELLKTGESPLDLTVIPNYMGINLCSVEAISWGRQPDRQLTDLTIHFKPNNE